MSANVQGDPGTGALSNLSQIYFRGFDALAKGCEPALLGIGRWNLEVLGLTMRRSRAWMDIPLQLGQCRTPIDVFNAQMKFWQSATQDYAESSRKLTTALGAFAVMPDFNGAWRGEAAAPARDYISVPERVERDAAATRKPGDRRAA
jgi:hypothetical protein